MSEPLDPTPTDADQSDPCNDCTGDSQTDSTCNGSAQSNYSSNPVRYSNGEVLLVEEDLKFKSFGIEWGHTRSYSNKVTDPGEGANGNSWFVKEWPYLSASNFVDPTTPGTLCLVWLISEALWFDYVPTTGGYRARFYVRPKLVHDATAKEYSLYDSEGRVTKFFDFDASYPAVKRGAFKSFTDPAGRETSAVYNSSNLIEKFEQSGDGQTSGYYYTYLSSGVNAGRLKEVEYKVDGTPVRKAEYSYYDGSTANGSAGDLELAKISQYQGGTWEEIACKYYRYYKAGDPNGDAHALRFVLSPLGYRQMEAQRITPETSTNQQLAGFARNEFRYGAARRVVGETVNAGTVNYGYSASHSSFPDGFNNWKTKTVETLPNGNRKIVYTNFAGQLILSVLTRMSGGQPTTDRWYAYKKYDDDGRTIMEASSSAVQSFSEAQAGLVTLKSHDGLIRTYEFYSASPGAGGAPNRLRYEKVQEGSAGTPIKLKEWQYVSRTVGPQTVYRTAKEIEYQSDASGGSDPAETSYSYTWDHLQVEEKTTTYPVVGTGQNGSGVADQMVEAYDEFGQLRWVKDPRGYITGYDYNSALGTLIQMVQDVGSGAPWSSLPGTHLDLVTDYEVDDQGRRIRELGPVHEIDIDETPTEIRRASWTVYHDVTRQVWRASGYQKVSDDSFTLINPVSISRFDEANRLVDQIEAVREDTDGPLSPDDDFPQEDWTKWTWNYYGRAADVVFQRRYFLIPDEGGGNEGVNYYQTDYEYDIMQRRIGMRDAEGTITQYSYNALNWMMSVSVGTRTMGGPWGTGTSNMRVVSSYQYDNGQSGGDGNLTLQSLPLGVTQARQTSYTYDFRNRRTSALGELNFYETYAYDNQNRLLQKENKDGSGGVLIGKTTNAYDSRGRQYESAQYAVNPSTGAEGNALKALTWYDGNGNVIKQRPMDTAGFTKMSYDALNRPIAVYQACDPDEENYAQAGSVDDDWVVEQALTTYDDGGNAIFTASAQRNHDTTGEGELSDSTVPQGRISYVAIYPDALGRTIAEANYGTNGGSAPTRPDTIPESSDTVLVTERTYDEAGKRVLATDAMGHVKLSAYDDLGRLVQTTENYVEEGTATDENRIIEYAYNGNNALTTLTVPNTQGGDEVTTWEYGTELSNSGVASNSLLRAKVYPDGGRQQYGYNQQSQIVSISDPNGTVRSLDYDDLGRLIHDRVTTLGSGVDGSVRRISRAYEVRGMLFKITSVDNSNVGVGTVVNEVAFNYNTFSQLDAEWQAVGGAVDGSTPSVTYGYADGSANTTRRSWITYPEGREVGYTYGATGSSIDDLTNRIESVTDSALSADPVATYTWLGASMPVRVQYLQPEIEMTLVGSGGDYTGLDQFNRVKDIQWLFTPTSDEVALIQYGFDRVGNRTWRKDPMATGFDDTYGYDGLYQIDQRKQGTLSGGTISSPPVAQEDFTYDRIGNWTNYQTKANGSVTLDQDRVHNTSNEITEIDGSSALVSYDDAGNMITTPKPSDWSQKWALTWDAWNRLTVVKTSTGSTVATYGYDGMNRRTKKTISSTTRSYYYSDQWQVLEERVGSSTSADMLNIWGVRYVDDLILRDNGTTGRLYAMQDQWNVVAIADDSGTVVERYNYSAFGDTQVLAPDYTTRSSSSYDWKVTYASYLWDAETGFYQVRYRYLQPLLGRWLSRDPAYEKAGINLYAYAGNNGVTSVDAFGLEHFKQDVTITTPISTSTDNQGRTISRGGDDISATIEFDYDIECDKNKIKKVTLGPVTGTAHTLIGNDFDFGIGVFVVYEHYSFPSSSTDENLEPKILPNGKSCERRKKVVKVTWQDTFGVSAAVGAGPFTLPFSKTITEEVKILGEFEFPISIECCC